MEEVSAKEGDNVREAFLKLMEKLRPSELQGDRAEPTTKN